MSSDNDIDRCGNVVDGGGDVACAGRLGSLQRGVIVDQRLLSSGQRVVRCSRSIDFFFAGGGIGHLTDRCDLFCHRVSSFDIDYLLLRRNEVSVIADQRFLISCQIIGVSRSYRNNIVFVVKRHVRIGGQRRYQIDYFFSIIFVAFDSDQLPNLSVVSCKVSADVDGIVCAQSKHKIIFVLRAAYHTNIVFVFFHIHAYTFRETESIRISFRRRTCDVNQFQRTTVN